MVSGEGSARRQPEGGPHRRTHRASAGPASVAAFLAHEADRGSRAATITRPCAAIRYAHQLVDLEPPTNSEHLRATLRGIKAPVLAAPLFGGVWEV
jgi:hypothetical protein